MERTMHADPPLRLRGPDRESEGSMSAKRGAVYQVVPVAGRWIVRASGRRGESYDRLEDALVAAEALVGLAGGRGGAGAPPRPEEALGGAD